MKTRHCTNPPTASGAFSNRLADWRVYAAAGGATLAATTNAAQASIIYQQLNVSTIDGASPDAFQVAGVQESVVNRDTFSPFTGNFERSVQFLQGGLQIQVDGNASPYARNFYSGSPIAGNFKNSVGVLHQVRAQLDSNSNIITGATTVRGHFSNGGAIGIVGFQLPNGDNGWLRLQFDSGFPNSQGYFMKLIDYAYNDVADAPINAGQTAPVPEPGSKALALLAFGSAGVLVWRRRNAECGVRNDEASSQTLANPA